MSKKKDSEAVKEMCERASMLLACLKARKEIDKRRKMKEQSKEKQQ